MKIVFTIADLQPESGGPSRSVPALAAAVAELGNPVEVLALDYGAGSNRPVMPPVSVQTTLVPCRGRQKFRCPPGFESSLLLAPGVSLLHDNGLWLPTNHAAAKVARQRGVPLIISPRGMLTPWAMRYHGFKKRLAWWLYQHRNLQSARVLHATSRREAEEFRALGMTQPIAMIPNGVGLPPIGGSVSLSASDGERVGVRWPVNSPRSAPSSNARTALFLSRIHPKKGLLDLVAAWAEIKKSEIGSWRMVIAGGDEGGHLAEVKAEIGKRKLETCFEFIGEVPDAKKWDVYRSADLFVLPTKSENFGIVIAEALACGVPVITTKGTPWEELNTHLCGWWVEIGAKPLAQALAQAMSFSDEERREMGSRGRKLVEENYTWPAAAQKMVAVYQWMLNAGPKPECLFD